ncbi:MAG TPA: histidine phosphatase family protein [Acidimicrobiales bacterium]
MHSDDSRSQPLILIRHGESTWNESGTVQGQADGATLTENGRLQVRKTAESFRGAAFDEIISSDLQRAVETAQIIADVVGLTVTTTSALRERSFGVFEGRPLADLGPELSGILDGKVVDTSAHPEGGESLDAFYHRVRSYMEILRGREDRPRMILVTHGGTIRVIRAYGAGTVMQDSLWYPVMNASLWTVTLDGRNH